MRTKILFPLILLVSISLLIKSSAIELSAKGACAIEAQTGEIVCEKNSNAKMSMASTTKIMTAIVAIENSSLSKSFKIPKEAVGIEGSSIYLTEGEELTNEELLYALLLESANDASVALAISCAGSVDVFVEMMNQKAKELGLTSTSFSNPHGLDDENHYTTPYELAKIAQYAMKNPVFRKIASTYKKTIPSGEDGTRVLINHNKLLKTYVGTVGIKTGFTKKSGRCLVSCAQRNGVEIVCVTLNAPDDWNDHKAMLDYGFNQYEAITLASPGDFNVSFSVQNGETSNVSCSNKETLSLTLKSGYGDISTRCVPNKALSAPVKAGDIVGKIIFTYNEKEIAYLNLYANENINKKKNSFLERIFG